MAGFYPCMRHFGKGYREKMHEGLPLDSLHIDAYEYLSLTFLLSFQEELP